MGLDIYTWLAQRLRRVPSGRPAFIPWGGTKGLHAQFGHGYERVRDFKRFFKKTLAQVKGAYPDANFELNDHT